MRYIDHYCIECGERLTDEDLKIQHCGVCAAPFHLATEVPASRVADSTVCAMSLQTLGENWGFLKQQLVDHLNGVELRSTSAHKKLKELLETL